MHNVRNIRARGPYAYIIIEQQCLRQLTIYGDSYKGFKSIVYFGFAYLTMRMFYVILILSRYNIHARLRLQCVRKNLGKMFRFDDSAAESKTIQCEWCSVKEGLVYKKCDVCAISVKIQ